MAGGNDREHLIKPYRLMGSILAGLDRDVVFNLCQYGMGNVWEWGGDVGGHCWRTTGDVGVEKSDRLPGFYRIGMSNASHFNDVNQDTLGQQARVLRQDRSDLVLCRPLEDGSVCVGIFNLGEEPRVLAVSLRELGIEGSWRVRDLWRQTDRNGRRVVLLSCQPPWCGAGETLAAPLIHAASGFMRKDRMLFAKTSRCSRRRG